MSETLTLAQLTAAIEDKAALADAHRRSCTSCALGRRCQRGRYLSMTLAELRARRREQSER